MEITLRNYRPFALTDNLLDTIKQESRTSSKNYLELIARVGRIALLTLSLLPVYLADLVITCSSQIYQIFCMRNPKRRVPQPQSPSPIDRNAPPFTNSKQFMKAALRQAFARLTPNRCKLYKELIADDGLPPENCEEYVDIFQWTAGVYLAHFLRNSGSDLSRLYPSSHPEFDHRKGQVHIQELQRKVRNLLVNYSLRTDDERNDAIRKIISPETILVKPKDEVKRLVNAINEIAVLMTQDPYFMKNIYTETATL